MSFLYNVFSRKNNKASGDLPAPNPRNKKLEEDRSKNTIVLQNKPTGKVGSREHWGPKRTQENIFKKNMKERKVRLELFLIEGENNFEEKSIRAQMNEVAYLGSDEFKNWFYDLGINEMLPSDWEQFKEMVVEFCTDAGIESVTKYRDEPWSKYLVRLKSYMISNNITEEKIFRKLRSEYLPSNIQVLVYSMENNLKLLIERVNEFEEFNSKKKN